MPAHTPRHTRPLAAAITLCVMAAIVASLPACDRNTNDNTTILDFWTLDLTPFSPYLTALIEDFEAQNPGVDVVWTDVPFSTLDRKLIAAAAAGRAPDVVNFSDMTFARFAALGATEDLTPHLTQTTTDAYLPDILSTLRINDQLLGLPWYLSTQTLIANEALLTQSGLTIDTLPTDWASLRTLAAEHRARTGTFLFSLPLGEESVLPWMLLADGINPFAEDDSGRLTANINTPEARDFLTAWVDMYRQGLLPREAATTGHAHLIDLYKANRLTLMNLSPNFLRRIRDESPSVFATTTVRPAITGRLGRTHVPVMLLSVTTQSDAPDLAAKLAAHITSPGAQLDFCRLVNILPSTAASLDDPHFDPPTATNTSATGTADHLINTARALSADALRTAVAFTPALETWPDLRRAFEDRFKRVLLDDAPLDDSLAAINRDWNAILAAAPPATMSAVPTPAQITTAPEPLAP